MIRTFSSGVKKSMQDAQDLTDLLHDLTCDCKHDPTVECYYTTGYVEGKIKYMDQADRLIGLLGDFDRAKGFVMDLRAVSPGLLIRLIEGEL